MKKIIRISVLLIVLAVFVGTLYFLYQKSQEKPVVFSTKNPIITNIEKKTVATGSIVPRKEIEIKPQISGIIEKLYVEAGQQVNEGDVIAKVKVIPDMLSLNNAEARLTTAQIALEQTKVEYERQKTLFDTKVIAQTQYLEAKTAYERARAEVDAADNNLQLIKEGASKRTGKITNTLVKATASGMVLEVPVEVGNSVIESNTMNAGTTIAIIANMQDMVFKGKIDESDVDKLKEGMKLELTVGAIDNLKYEALLEHVSPKGREENGAIQFEIKAKVSLQANQFIRAGYSANASMVLERRENVLAIDEALLITRNDSSFVEVRKKDQEFEERYLRTGLSDGINVEVLEGLTQADEVKIINGVGANKKPELAAK